MKILKNLNLCNYNAYRIESFCEIAYFPENENDILELFINLKDFLLLGSGHNIIFSKHAYQKPFVIFNGNFNSIQLTKDGLIEVEAGAMMWNVSEFALAHNFTGLEIFCDIPSSLGGAVVMNAGASGEEIKDVLVKVRYLDLKDGFIKEILKEDISFEYRNSFFQQHQDKIVLKAWLKLNPGNYISIKDKMENIKLSRWAKQPRDLPNCGSVFKRPKGFFVGAMIDELELKGLTIGGAQISKKHGGFIVNIGNATGEDILNLIDVVQQKVFDVYGVTLEVEQRII